MKRSMGIRTLTSLFANFVKAQTSLSTQSSTPKSTAFSLNMSIIQETLICPLPVSIFSGQEHVPVQRRFSFLTVQNTFPFINDQFYPIHLYWKCGLPQSSLKKYGISIITLQTSYSHVVFLLFEAGRWVQWGWQSEWAEVIFNQPGDLWVSFIRLIRAACVAEQAQTSHTQR